MISNPLGHKIAIPDSYSPAILYPIERAEGRRTRSYPEASWLGFDRWRCYEFSCVVGRRRVITGILSFSLDAKCPRIVESKSLKLYLGSLNNCTFSSTKEALDTVARDIRSCLDSDLPDLNLRLEPPAAVEQPQQAFSWGRNIDGFEENSDEKPSSHESYALVSNTSHTVREEVLHTHLLRTLCPITSQPDWATVWLSYTGVTINYTWLTSYIISLRQHSGYHESCCEEIFETIVNSLNPQQLTLACFFTRRGGIDINPVRWLHYGQGSIRDVEHFPRVWRQ
jgi:7-cyano-7-deazaguanine reductase